MVLTGTYEHRQGLGDASSTEVISSETRDASWNSSEPGGKTPKAFANSSPTVGVCDNLGGHKTKRTETLKALAIQTNSAHSPTLSALELFSVRVYPGLRQPRAAISERLRRSQRTSSAYCPNAFGVLNERPPRIARTPSAFSTNALRP